MNWRHSIWREGDEKREEGDRDAVEAKTKTQVCSFCLFLFKQIIIII